MRVARPGDTLDGNEHGDLEHENGADAGAIAVCAAPVVAQTPAEQELADYERMLDELERSFIYRQGTVTLGDGLATLHVPERFRFLGPADAQRLIEEGWGNPPGDAPLAMLVTADASPLDAVGWGVIITFEEDGHARTTTPRRSTTTSCSPTCRRARARRTRRARRPATSRST